MTALRQRQRTVVSVLLCTTSAAAFYLICGPAQRHAAPRLIPLAKCTLHLQEERKRQTSHCTWRVGVKSNGHASGLGLFFHGGRRVDVV